MTSNNVTTLENNDSSGKAVAKELMMPRCPKKPPLLLHTNTMNQTLATSRLDKFACFRITKTNENRRKPENQTLTIDRDATPSRIAIPN